MIIFRRRFFEWYDIFRLENCIADGRFGLNISSCGWPFSLDHEETRAQFCKRWDPCDSLQGLPLYPEYWKFQDSWESGSYFSTGRLSTYSGNGYIIDIGKSKILTDSSLKYLMRTNWLDDFTRSVFVDFTVYNTNANFYVMVMFLLEIPANGGAFVFKRILTTRLDRYSSGFAAFLGACELLFLCFSVYYMYREVLKFKHLRWRYFKNWENWVEILSFVFIWTSFGLLIVRFGVVSTVKGKYFRAPEDFVNFETAALSDRVYGYILAFVVTILFIKFLKLLRFNRKMSLMYKTLSYASNDLRYFSITLLIVVCAYASLTHLLYISHVEGYSTFIYTLESLLNLVLGSFNYHVLIATHPALGKIFFVSYVIVMTWILLNMFISIINEAFSTVAGRVKVQKNKYELIDFLTQRIRGFLPAFLTRKKLSAVVVDGPEVGKLLLGDMGSVSVSQPSFISMNSPQMKDLKHRIDRCEEIVQALDGAIDCIAERVEYMIKEEEYEQRMWEYLLELVEIKFPRIHQKPTMSSQQLQVED